MKKYLLSFCIASYCRGSLVAELVSKLLKVQDDRFEIVICDNHSEDRTLEIIKSIPEWSDKRIRIIENSENIGAMRNFYKSLTFGEGEFLFYINDRDWVEPFKVPVLLDILEELNIKNVAFATCIRGKVVYRKKYHIIDAGKDSLMEFGCRLSHPTGYIFKKDALDEINDAGKYYEDEYGNYGYSMLCALMSRKYKGAYIFGDICEVLKKRLDFTTEKSRFYQDRKVKNIYYSVEALYRELTITYYFLKDNVFEQEWIEELLFKRFKDYLCTVMTNYSIIIKNPLNTQHYGLPLINDDKEIMRKSLQNGIELKQKVMAFCHDIGIENLENAIEIYTDAEIDKFILQNF